MYDYPSASEVTPRNICKCVTWFHKDLWCNYKKIHTVCICYGHLLLCPWRMFTSLPPGNNSFIEPINSSINFVKPHHTYSCYITVTSQWARWRLNSWTSHECLLNGLFRRISKKHQSSASLAFVLGFHRWPVNSPLKGPVRGKCLHLMTASWNETKWPV